MRTNYKSDMMSYSPDNYAFAHLVFKNEGDWNKVWQELNRWSLHSRGFPVVKTRPRRWTKIVDECFKNVMSVRERNKNI